MICSKPFNPDTDIPSLKGRVVVVTGGNSGIGLSTVKLLARKGAKVYLGARTEEKFNTAFEELQNQGIGDGDVVWLPCDLSSPQKSKESAEGLLKKVNRLDILVNNAAMIDAREKITFNVDGVPDMMIVNYIGPFVFTNTLLPVLIKTSQEPDSDVRIITVSSIGHSLTGATTNPRLHFKTVDALKETYQSSDRLPGFPLYGITKLGNVLFSSHLQHLLTSKKHNITCISLHPGAVDTFSHRIPLPFSLVVRLFFKDTDAGAYTSVHAAASPEAKEWKGKYVEPVGRVATPGKNARRVDLREELWATTNEYLKTIEIEFDV